MERVLLDLAEVHHRAQRRRRWAAPAARRQPVDSPTCAPATLSRSARPAATWARLAGIHFLVAMDRRRAEALTLRGRSASAGCTCASSPIGDVDDDVRIAFGGRNGLAARRSRAGGRRRDRVIGRRASRLRRGAVAADTSARVRAVALGALQPALRACSRGARRRSPSRRSPTTTRSEVRRRALVCPKSRCCAADARARRDGGVPRRLARAAPGEGLRRCRRARSPPIHRALRPRVAGRRRRLGRCARGGGDGRRARGGGGDGAAARARRYLPWRQGADRRARRWRRAHVARWPPRETGADGPEADAVRRRARVGGGLSTLWRRHAAEQAPGAAEEEAAAWEAVERARPMQLLPPSGCGGGGQRSVLR